MKVQKKKICRELKPPKNKVVKVFTLGGFGAKIINIPKYEIENRLNWAVGDKLEYSITSDNAFVLKKKV